MPLVTDVTYFVNRVPEEEKKTKKYRPYSITFRVPPLNSVSNRRRRKKKTKLTVEFIAELILL